MKFDEEHQKQHDRDQLVPLRDKVITVIWLFALTFFVTVLFLKVFL